MTEHKREPMTFVDLALALADDYSRLFVIDAEDDSYIEYSHNADLSELVPVSHGSDFFSDVRRDVREQVWQEDQEYFLNAFGKEAMTGSLKDGKSFSLTYRLNIGGEPRYYFLKTIRSNNRNIIIGVQDIDAQKRRELENEETSKTYSEVADSLASLFEVIYYVDIKTGHYLEYSASESYADLGFNRGGEDFFTVAEHDIAVVLHPDDAEAVRQQLTRDSLIEALERTGSVSLTYRQVLDGRTQYVNLLAFRSSNDDEHIVIGVRNIDAQKRQEHTGRTYSQIAGALASRYEVIYYINTNTHEYTQYTSGGSYALLVTTKEGKEFFGDAEEDIKKYIHVYDANRVQSFLSKDHLLPELEQNGTMTMTYRQLIDGRYQYMSMMAVKPKNDSDHIIIGVSNVDSQTRRVKSMELKNRTFSDISMALALQYEVIYHVNLITNEYSEYSASEKFRRLEVGANGKDFFAETAENMKKDIYSEDLPMMNDAMKKENLLRSMSESGGKLFLNYRLMLDDRPQYVSLYAVRPKEDSDHIIVAVANVDKAKRMELDYRNAVDMANRDALTGVKNKRAYAQAEMELDDSITKDKINAFAILICDINGLKEINDTFGHKAGDDFIRSGCAVICDVFDHSPVFRIGGDEFAVIVKDRDFERRSELMKKLSEIQQENWQKGLVTLACGISEFTPNEDIRVQDVFERADSLMYINKKIIKEQFGM